MCESDEAMKGIYPIQLAKLILPACFIITLILLEDRGRRTGRKWEMAFSVHA